MGKFNETRENARNVFRTLENLSRSEEIVFFNLRLTMSDIETLMRPILAKEGGDLLLSIPEADSMVVGSRDIFSQPIFWLMDCLGQQMKNSGGKGIVVTLSGEEKRKIASVVMVLKGGKRGVTAKKGTSQMKSRHLYRLLFAPRATGGIGLRVHHGFDEKHGEFFKNGIPLPSTLKKRENTGVKTSKR